MLVEKLILTGLLIFIDQGSIFQAFCGGVVAFVFFAVQCMARPYASVTDNILKGVAEAELFITLFISVILRTDVADGQDTITAGQYGTILTAVFFAAPITCAACFLYNRCCAKEALDKELHGLTHLRYDEKMAADGDVQPQSASQAPSTKGENENQGKDKNDEGEDTLKNSLGVVGP